MRTKRVIAGARRRTLPQVVVLLTLAAYWHSACAQSGEIIILRQLSPRMAIKPADSVTSGGPVRASAWAGREDLIEAGTSGLANGGVSNVSDEALGQTISRTLQNQFSDALTSVGAPRSMPSNLFGTAPAAQFVQPMQALTQSLGAGAASVGRAVQDMGTQVQRSTAGIGATVLGGVLP